MRPLRVIGIVASLAVSGIAARGQTLSGDWLVRSLFGSVEAVHEDGTLSVRVSEETIAMLHLGPIAAGGSKSLGTRVYRLAGTEVAPALNETRLLALREWLVGTEVELRIGRAFSANDAPQPVPAVILARRGNAQINEQFVRRGFGQVRVDAPDAIGASEWSKIVAAAQRR